MPSGEFKIAEHCTGLLDCLPTAAADPLKPLADIDGSPIVYRPDYYNDSQVPLKLTSTIVPVTNEAGGHEALLVKPSPRLIFDVTRYCSARCPACINAMYDATMPEATKGEKVVREITTITQAAGEGSVRLRALAETGDAYLDAIKQLSRFAVERAGVRTYSITGGEPTILGAQLLRILKAARVSDDIEKIKLFTHAGPLRRSMFLQRVLDAGVNELTVSRHHDDESVNKAYMGKGIPTNEELATIISQAGARGVETRFSTMIQRGYIETPEDIERFLKFARAMGVVEVVFRALARTEATTDEHSDAVARWTKENAVDYEEIVTGAADIRGLDLLRVAHQTVKSRVFGRYAGGLAVIFEQKHDPEELNTDIGVITSFPSSRLLPDGTPEGSLLAYRWVDPQAHAINYRGADWTNGLSYFRPPQVKQ
jgi:molybdenum cofactor biosynthesis enzyme MoaA